MNIGSKVAITDFRGQEIYHVFVQPTIAVTDYRTASTGIEAAHLQSSEPLAQFV